MSVAIVGEVTEIDFLVWTRAVALLTSILRPSTILPLSCSRALSASLVTAKVTNPKPLEPRSLKIISTSRMGPNCWGLQEIAQQSKRETEKQKITFWLDVYKKRNVSHLTPKSWRKSGSLNRKGMLLTWSLFGWLLDVTKIWLEVDSVLVAELTLKLISFKGSFGVRRSFLLQIKGEEGAMSDLTAKLL